MNRNNKEHISLSNQTNLKNSFLKNSSSKNSSSKNSSSKNSKPSTYNTSSNVIKTPILNNINSFNSRLNVISEINNISSTNGSILTGKITANEIYIKNDNNTFTNIKDDNNYVNIKDYIKENTSEITTTINTIGNDNDVNIGCNENLENPKITLSGNGNAHFSGDVVISSNTNSSKNLKDTNKDIVLKSNDGSINCNIITINNKGLIQSVDESNEKSLINLEYISNHINSSGNYYAILEPVNSSNTYQDGDYILRELSNDLRNYVLLQYKDNSFIECIVKDGILCIIKDTLSIYVSYTNNNNKIDWKQPPSSSSTNVNDLTVKNSLTLHDTTIKSVQKIDGESSNNITISSIGYIDYQIDNIKSNMNIKIKTDSLEANTITFKNGDDYKNVKDYIDEQKTDIETKINNGIKTDSLEADTIEADTIEADTIKVDTITFKNGDDYKNVKDYIDDQKLEIKSVIETEINTGINTNSLQANEILFKNGDDYENVKEYIDNKSINDFLTQERVIYSINNIVYTKPESAAENDPQYILLSDNNKLYLYEKQQNSNNSYTYELCNNEKINNSLCIIKDINNIYVNSSETTETQNWISINKNYYINAIIEDNETLNETLNENLNKTLNENLNETPKPKYRFIHKNENNTYALQVLKLNDDQTETYINYDDPPFGTIIIIQSTKELFIKYIDENNETNQQNWVKNQLIVNDNNSDNVSVSIGSDTNDATNISLSTSNEENNNNSTISVVSNNDINSSSSGVNIISETSDNNNNSSLLVESGESQVVSTVNVNTETNNNNGEVRILLYIDSIKSTQDETASKITHNRITVDPTIATPLNSLNNKKIKSISSNSNNFDAYPNFIVKNSKNQVFGFNYYNMNQQSSLDDDHKFQIEICIQQLIYDNNSKITKDYLYTYILNDDYLKKTIITENCIIKLEDHKYVLHNDILYMLGQLYVPFKDIPGPTKNNQTNDEQIRYVFYSYYTFKFDLSNIEQNDDATINIQTTSNKINIETLKNKIQDIYNNYPYEISVKPEDISLKSIILFDHNINVIISVCNEVSHKHYDLFLLNYNKIINETYEVKVVNPNKFLLSYDMSNCVVYNYNNKDTIYIGTNSNDYFEPVSKNKVIRYYNFYKINVNYTDNSYELSKIELNLNYKPIKYENNNVNILFIQNDRLFFGYTGQQYYIYSYDLIYDLTSQNNSNDTEDTHIICYNIGYSINVIPNNFSKTNIFKKNLEQLKEDVNILPVSILNYVIDFNKNIYFLLDDNINYTPIGSNKTNNVKLVMDKFIEFKCNQKSEYLYDINYIYTPAYFELPTETDPYYHRNNITFKNFFILNNNIIFISEETNNINENNNKFSFEYYEYTPLYLTSNNQFSYKNVINVNDNNEISLNSNKILNDGTIITSSININNLTMNNNENTSTTIKYITTINEENYLNNSIPTTDYLHNLINKSIKDVNINCSIIINYGELQSKTFNFSLNKKGIISKINSDVISIIIPDFSFNLQDLKLNVIENEQTKYIYLVYSGDDNPISYKDETYNEPYEINDILHNNKLYCNFVINKIFINEDSYIIYNEPKTMTCTEYNNGYIINIIKLNCVDNKGVFILNNGDINGFMLYERKDNNNVNYYGIINFENILFSKV